MVKDLGVVLDERMTFKAHLNQVVARAKCTLGLMKRLAKDFDCPYVTRSLYCALVRPTLEYCSIVWDPVFEVDKKRVESVQKQFIIFALRYLGWQDPFHLPSYESRLQLIDMHKLSVRRSVAACTLVVSCLNGETKSSAIASQFRFHTPTRVSRSASAARKLCLLPLARPLYVNNSPLRRCIESFNEVAHLYTPGMSTQKFRSAVLSFWTTARRN